MNREELKQPGVVDVERPLRIVSKDNAGADDDGSESNRNPHYRTGASHIVGMNMPTRHRGIAPESDRSVRPNDSPGDTLVEGKDLTRAASDIEIHLLAVNLPQLVDGADRPALAAEQEHRIAQNSFEEGLQGEFTGKIIGKGGEHGQLPVHLAPNASTAELKGRDCRAFHYSSSVRRNDAQRTFILSPNVPVREQSIHFRSNVKFEFSGALVRVGRGVHPPKRGARFDQETCEVLFMWDFLQSHSAQIAFSSWQHVSLVAQCLVLATILAVALAAVAYRSSILSSAANSLSAIGLTIPAFALVGLVIAPLGFGVPPAVAVVTFFAILPILRNTVVGLKGVDPAVVESARGIGMSRIRTFLTVELPLAWPVILGGIRVSAQMIMGIAAVAAYVLGPGLGGFIFSGLSRLGGANSLESVLTGVLGVVILALILDLVLVGLGRLTTPRGIRV